MQRSDIRILSEDEGVQAMGLSVVQADAPLELSSRNDEIAPLMGIDASGEMRLDQKAGVPRAIGQGDALVGQLAVRAGVPANGIVGRKPPDCAEELRALWGVLRERASAGVGSLDLRSRP